MTHEHQAGAMWGGRFESAPDVLLRALNDSLPVDWRLVREDIEGSRAWARALVGAGVLTTIERDRLLAALDAVQQEADALDATPPIESGAEDVHSWVEQRLIALVGDLGKKLHTGRSRNDQVATDFRLWTRGAIDARLGELARLRAVLIDVAQRHAGTVFPGYTHLQRAQPITFGHWCLAYETMLARDANRLRDARARVNVCPLGSAALAGTAYRIDRDTLAHELGFASASVNSLDAVADRDFALETLSALEILALHLSRLAEDLVLYSSQEFALVELDDRVTSGSSIMPQKKNPDAMELVRSLAGRVMGARIALSVAIKGLPLAYNKDLQDDKRCLFDAMDAVALALPLSTLTISTLTVDTERAASAAIGGFANATELADALVEARVPFRDAHEQVGRIVKLCLARSVTLEALPIQDMRQIAPRVPADIAQRLSAASAVARRDVVGGTSPERVRVAAANARRQLEAEG